MNKNRRELLELLPTMPKTPSRRPSAARCPIHGCPLQRAGKKGSGGAPYCPACRTEQRCLEYLERRDEKGGRCGG